MLWKRAENFENSAFARLTRDSAFKSLFNRGGFMRYKITLSYDGSGFCGWQSQKSGGSIQDAVEFALEKLTGIKTRVTASGRTDAGVHALAQVAHFDIEKDLTEKTVIGGLNAYLPRSVRVLAAERANDNFDARKSAKRKTYMYLMYRGSELPVLSGRALCIGDNVNVDAMRDAARFLAGTHDFKTFMASGGGAKTSVRTVYDARFEDDKFFVKFYITANGFLYNMVRIIVAQLLKIGKGGNIDMRELIALCDRNNAKELAPPDGLYLYDVKYE